MLDRVKNILRAMIAENKGMLRPETIRQIGEIHKLAAGEKQTGLVVRDRRRWTRAFCRLMRAGDEFAEVAEAFFTDEIDVLREAEQTDRVIAICVEKNELEKMKHFLDHHRALGVRNFVVLDNDSTDGTLEWLMQQHDVTLIQTKVPYSTARREGWINRILAYYGERRWYLVMDADECLVYPGCEQHGIDELIRYLEERHIRRARAMMLDMYADAEYYQSGHMKEFGEKCIYFDASGYEEKRTRRLIMIRGGFRGRIFGEMPCLTKYPLFWLSHTSVECKSHFLFPFADNFACDQSILALKHYKFLPGEAERYRQIARDGNYFHHSSQYKRYVSVMDSGEKMNFLADVSARYEGSASLSRLPTMGTIDWKNHGKV